MGDVEPRHYIMGIILFTMVLVGGISLISIFNDDDPTYVDQDKFSEFNQSFNVLNDLTTEVNELETGISESEPDIGVFGVLNALISSAWQTLKLLFTSFSFMNAAFNGISSVFGIPTWVPQLIISAVTIVFVFFIFKLIFRQ